jgi:hypothetical protein
MQRQLGVGLGAVLGLVVVSGAEAAPRDGRPVLEGQRHGATARTYAAPAVRAGSPAVHPSYAADQIYGRAARGFAYGAGGARAYGIGPAYGARGVAPEWSAAPGSGYGAGGYARPGWAWGAGYGSAPNYAYGARPDCCTGAGPGMAPEQGQATPMRSAQVGAMGAKALPISQHRRWATRPCPIRRGQPTATSLRPCMAAPMQLTRCLATTQCSTPGSDGSPLTKSAPAQIGRSAARLTLAEIPSPRLAMAEPRRGAHRASEPIGGRAGTRLGLCQSRKLLQDRGTVALHQAQGLFKQAQ